MVTPAREAASAIVLRESPDGLEVLLVERNPEQRFMPGAWVFPGGAVHDGDDGPAAAAVRELEEEAGIRLGPEAELVPYSRWITPKQVKIRFDTWFFVVAAPAGVDPVPDGAECVDARWLRPADALDAHGRGELELVFPTIKHLEQLAKLGSLDEAFASARSRTIEPVEPRLVSDESGGRIVLPGWPGYEA